LTGEALYPFTEGRIGKVEQRGDGIDVVARDDLTDRLRAAKDPGFCRLLEHGLSCRQRIIAKVAFEGTHRFAPWRRITACYTLLIGAKWLRLKFPRFCLQFETIEPAHGGLPSPCPARKDLVGRDPTIVTHPQGC
jgi:hypothetical protein